MVIMATNNHMGLDEAMHRRIDDAIKMPLPEKEERCAALQHYRQKDLRDQTILHEEQVLDKITKQCGTNEKLKESYLALSHRQAIFKKKNGPTFDESVQRYVTDEKLRKIAGKTEGFSYGDMQCIINKVKTDAFTAKDGLLSPQLINRAVKEYKEKYDAFKPKPPLAGQRGRC